jgi:hypothetical protein
MQINNAYNIDDIFVRLHERYNADRNKSLESREQGDPWDDTISVTELINPSQITILKQYYSNQCTKDINDLIPSILGNAVHEALANTDSEQTYSEERLYAGVNGLILSGQPDRIFKEQNTHRFFKNTGSASVKDTWAIQDYKFTGAYSTYKHKKEWEEQLNCYAYLCKEGKTGRGGILEVDINHLFVTAIVRDWNHNNTGKENYPSSWVVDIEIPLWSHEEQKEFIFNKVNEYNKALEKFKKTDELPRCSDEERWSSGGGFAVMKPKRKTAVKLFDSEQEAQEYSTTIPTSYVESRTVKYMRCDRYCDVSKFCKQILE